MEADDGIRLVADVWGPDEGGEAVACLPGLTRNARDFTALCHALDEAAHRRRRIVALEARGRGRSGWASADTYTLTQEAADVVTALDALGLERVQIVGTSRGGLLAMLLSMTVPERVGRTVLNDIGPVIDKRGLTRLFASVGEVMDFPSFDNLAASLEEGLGEQFPHLGPPGWMRLARQLASPVNGGVRLDYDPALGEAFREAPTGDAPDAWPAFEALARRPVLVIRGINSDILSAATVEAMQRRPSVTSLSVPGEGHAPLLWDRRTQNAIGDFLAA